jgi:hypothetical protein
MRKRHSFILAILLCPSILAFGQWSGDPMENIMVRDTNGMLIVAHVAACDNGNSYVSWYSATDGFRFDLAMQYFDINGQKLWGDNGLMISTQPTDTWVTEYGLAADNLGYAIVTNQDYRDGYSNAFAWRISPEGQQMWGEEGLRLTDGDDFIPWPQVLVTEDNKYIFLYGMYPLDTTQNTSIGIQQINSAGVKEWESSISRDTLNYMLPQQVLAGDGSLYVGWTGYYNGPDTVIGQMNYMHYYLQKFDNLGQPVWPEPLQLDTGEVITIGSLYPLIRIASDGENGVYVMWPWFIDTNPAVMISRVSPEGQSLWDPYGTPVAVNPGHAFEEGTLCYNEDYGHAYAFWSEVKYDPGQHTYCYGIGGQKFSPGGDRLWGDTARRIIPYICSSDTNLFGASVRPAGDQGNALIHSKEYLDIQGVDTMMRTEINATLLDGDGGYVWPEKVIPVTTCPSYKLQCDLSCFSQGQWVMAWSDNRQHIDELENTGIYAQNFTLDGSLGPLALPEALPASSQALKCYPNPFTDRITIEYEQDVQQEITISLFDIQGRVVWETIADRPQAGSHVLEVNTPDLEPGIYIFQARAGHKTTISRIIKTASLR